MIFHHAKQYHVILFKYINFLVNFFSQFWPMTMENGKLSFLFFFFFFSVISAYQVNYALISIFCRFWWIVLISNKVYLSVFFLRSGNDYVNNDGVHAKPTLKSTIFQNCPKKEMEWMQYAINRIIWCKQTEPNINTIT